MDRLSMYVWWFIWIILATIITVIFYKRENKLENKIDRLKQDWRIMIFVIEDIIWDKKLTQKKKLEWIKNLVDMNMRNNF